jgi:hypothetical protein
MMKGYLDNGNQNAAVVNVTGLPPDPNGYSVYVYADGAAGGSNSGIYQISGPGFTPPSSILTYTSNFAGTFTQATQSSPIGNYVVLTIPATSAFTLSAIPSTASSGYKRAPINGIQIVPLWKTADEKREQFHRLRSVRGARRESGCGAGADSAPSTPWRSASWAS